MTGFKAGKNHYCLSGCTQIKCSRAMIFDRELVVTCSCLKSKFFLHCLVHWSGLPSPGKSPPKPVIHSLVAEKGWPQPIPSDMLFPPSIQSTCYNPAPVSLLRWAANHVLLSYNNNWISPKNFCLQKSSCMSSATLAVLHGLLWLSQISA